MGSRANRYKPRHRRDDAAIVRRRVIGGVLVAVAAISATLAIARPVERAAVARRARAAAAAARAEPHATLQAGAYWAKLSPSEREAYLTGVLAGAAAEQVRARAEQAGRGDDSAAVSSTTIDALRGQRALHYRFAPHVYSVQIDDFYWNHDHATTPIVDAMISFNREMLKQQAAAVPR